MNVPAFRQQKDTCGPTSLRMVLAYYGVKADENKLIKQVGGIKSYGVQTIALAKVAREYGMKTEALSYNVRLAKEQAKIKIPSKQDILKHLKKGRPIILCVRSWILYDEKPSKEGHFIVISGYRKGTFLYNDPIDGKPDLINEDKLLFLWLNHVTDSSAYLLAIWPKNVKPKTKQARKK